MKEIHITTQKKAIIMESEVFIKKFALGTYSCILGPWNFFKHCNFRKK